MSKTAFLNGKVYVDAGHFEQAVLQEDGIIKAVGTNGEILGLCDWETEKIDCGGKTVIPGLNDSHMHLLMIGEVLNEPPIGGCKSVEDMVEICKKFAAENPDAIRQGMHGQGWNQDLFEEGKVRLPNRDDLDQISTEYPIMLERVCGHTCALNSKALEILGINDDTPVDFYEGGTIERDANGRVNGYVTENAVYEVRKVVPSADPAGMRKELLSAMRYATEHGLTSVQSNDLGFMIPNSDENFKVYKDLYDNKEASIRFRHQVCCLLEKDLDEFLAGEYANRQIYDKYNGWLTLGPLKMFKDGSIGARTALMREPYVDDPTNYGIDSLEQGLMETLVKKAAANGLQCVTHVIGDRAVELTNQAYEKVLVDGKNPLRNCLIHCELTGMDLLEYIKKTDTLIAYQPVFLQGDQYTMATRFKPELIKTSLACKTVIDMGIHASYGTDSPVEDSNPFANIYCAVNRKDLTGKPEEGWNTQECVTVEQAIDAYTVESAYMEFAEEYKGRIKPGYYADLEILDTDIFTCDPMDIIHILPELVMVGGEIVLRDKIYQK